MEQHRTRPPRPGARRGTPGTPPLPPQAGRARGDGGRTRPARPGLPGPGTGAGADGSAKRRPGPQRRPPQSPAPSARRLPNPRLTRLGGGVFAAVVMFLLGCLDELLFGASLTAYGALFVPVCALTAFWVRSGDLTTAPVVVPIAFAVGLLAVAEGGEGVSGHAVGLVTALSTEVGWLYAGTLLAVVIVLVRRVRLLSRRRAAAARQASQASPAQSPGT
ncbi:DUF6542 domain-containing protein [Streptomyces sp. NPDC090306]|uniref:DUF6542 domain-containing protein n=1 Tax=Streptomyces sp. NPDC090306 TaxID=3365961 RepID=UPI00382C05FA